MESAKKAGEQAKHGSPGHPDPTTYQSSKEGARVEEDEQIHGKRPRHDGPLGGVELDVEKGYVDAHVAEEHGHPENGIRRFFPSRQVHEPSPYGGFEPHPHAHHGNTESRQHDERHQTDRPTEADARLKLVEEDRIDDTTLSDERSGNRTRPNAFDGKGKKEGKKSAEKKKVFLTQTTPAGTDALRQGPLAGEVRGEHGDGGHEVQPAAQPDDQPLSEHELPVPGAQTRHHHAEDQGEGPGEEQGTQVPLVEKGARESPDSDQQARLERSDPRYVRRGFVAEAAPFVVVLEDACGTLGSGKKN